MKSHPHHNRKLIVTACLSAGIILAALIAVTVWAVLAKNSYKNSFLQSKSAIGNALQDSYLELKQSKSNAEQTYAALDEIKNKLSEQANNLKQPPQILNIQLLPAKDAADIKQKLEEAANEIGKSIAVLDYQAKVLAIIQKPGNKTGNNASEQTGLAQAWLEVTGELHKITPPASQESAHQKLLQAVKEAQTTLASLPELTNKGDWQGFKAKQTELENRFTSLRQLAGAFTAVLVEQDKMLQTKLEDLQKSL